MGWGAQAGLPRLGSGGREETTPLPGETLPLPSCPASAGTYEAVQLAAQHGGSAAAAGRAEGRARGGAALRCGPGGRRDPQRPGRPPAPSLRSAPGRGHRRRGGALPLLRIVQPSSSSSSSPPPLPPRAESPLQEHRTEPSRAEPRALKLAGGDCGAASLEKRPGMGGAEKSALAFRANRRRRRKKRRRRRFGGRNAALQAGRGARRTRPAERRLPSPVRPLLGWAPPSFQARVALHTPCSPLLWGGPLACTRPIPACPGRQQRPRCTSQAVPRTSGRDERFGDPPCAFSWVAPSPPCVKLERCAVRVRDFFGRGVRLSRFGAVAAGGGADLWAAEPKWIPSEIDKKRKDSEKSQQMSQRHCKSL